MLLRPDHARRTASSLGQTLVFAATSALLVPAFKAAPARAQEMAPSPLANLNWQIGPTKADVGAVAQIDVPDGYRFLGGADTRTLLEAMQNPTSGDELGLLMPTADDQDWFVVFEFSDVGYIKDDEKDELDADAMLKSIRDGTERSNEERKKRGWATMSIVGWEQPPRYDTASNNLEWAIRGESEGRMNVNYNTRLLGRTGVMEVNLVVGPEELAATLPTFKGLLGGFSFKPGSRYSEFRSGDKIAKYGLTALVTGGAAAIALKTGLFQKLWKFIVAGVIGIAALIKRIAFGRRAESIKQP